MAPLLNYVQTGLKKFTEFQIRNVWAMALVILLFTLLVGAGASQIRLESDLSTLDPQDLDFTKLNNDINTDFQRFESTVLVIQIDPEVNAHDPIEDIRDPRVIEFIQNLDHNLRDEATIQDVTSLAVIFDNAATPQSLQESQMILSQVPESDGFFDQGYQWTIIFIEADVGGDDAKISELNERIDEVVQATTRPAGIKVTTTGDAPLTSAIFRLMISDAFFTLIFASIVIFLLVLVLERSLKQAIIIMVPLFFGLTWTVGTMGWLNIPITIATAAMGAMLLGLGVEYSIFLISRFEEERKKHSREDAIIIAVSSVGATLVSSGSTTLIGFLALSLSIFPVLASLGLTLALGIFYMLLATIVASPIIILLEDRLESFLRGKDVVQHGAKAREKEFKKLGLDKIYHAYGKFLSMHPYVILSIALLITLAMFYGISTIQNQDVDFDTILPNDLDVVSTYIQLNDEFGRTSSMLIYIEVDPTNPSSTEPRDIRDPDIIAYIDRLSKKSIYVQDALEVQSIATFIRQQEGQLPKTILASEIWQRPGVENYVTQDYAKSIIRITINEDADNAEVVRQVEEIIATTPRPAGLTVLPSGSLLVQEKLNALNGPDSSRTSLLALAGIIIFLYILTRRVKSTVLPLFTVVLGIIWTLGLTGFFRVPFNNITSSVITMTIGIGIDFGLQVVNRFNQELEEHDKQKAMEITITNILTPMIITAVAALIGFRAMGLGQLKIMNDLGILMSFGVAGSMLVAITAVAALTLIFEKDAKNSTKQKLKKHTKQKKP